RAPAHRLHALVAQPEHATRLGLGGNLQRHLTVERRHLDAAPQNRGRKADGNLAGQVLAVALEDLVFAHVHFDVQIAGGGARAHRLALARQADAVAGIDAGWNFHREPLAPAHAPLSQATVAGILDDGAG